MRRCPQRPGSTGRRNTAPDAGRATVESVDRPHSGSSLTGWLRDRSDQELVDLLASRPDLATPLPTDLGVLATRLASRPSVSRALDSLSTADLEVLQALCVLGPVGLDQVIAFLGADAGQDATAVVPEVLERLCRHAVVYVADGLLHVIDAARDLCGQHPLGLGRPVAALLAPLDVDTLRILTAANALDGPPTRAGALAALDAMFTDDASADPDTHGPACRGTRRARAAGAGATGGHHPRRAAGRAPRGGPQPGRGPARAGPARRRRPHNRRTAARDRPGPARSRARRRCCI